MNDQLRKLNLWLEEFLPITLIAIVLLIIFFVGFYELFYSIARHS